MSEQDFQEAGRCHACRQPLGLRATDKLTGLLDRWGWDDRAVDRLIQAQQDRDPICLLLIDIDRFKSVNDEYGHVAGDAVLRSLAGVLQTAAHDDDLVGRYGGRGGDEFLFLTSGGQLTGFFTVAERIRMAVKALSVPVKGFDGSPVIVSNRTVSIGMACRHPGDSVDLIDLIYEADEALHAAKLRGRDQVRCAPSLLVTPVPFG
jgi:diguanylate cyclase (GGDEF)-like protein